MLTGGLKLFPHVKETTFANPRFEKSGTYIQRKEGYVRLEFEQDMHSPI